MFNRTTSTIILVAFVAALVPAPYALALRQETVQAISTAHAVGTELSAAKGAGDGMVPTLKDIDPQMHEFLSRFFDPDYKEGMLGYSVYLEGKMRGKMEGSAAPNMTHGFHNLAIIAHGLGCKLHWTEVPWRGGGMIKLAPWAMPVEENKLKDLKEAPADYREAFADFFDDLDKKLEDIKFKYDKAYRHWQETGDRSLLDEVPLPAIPTTESPLDTLCALVGPTRALEMLRNDEKEATRIMDIAVDTTIGFVKYLKENYPGINLSAYCSTWMPEDMGTSIGEDNMTGISPEMYERLVLPRLERIGEALGGYFLHMCGDITPYLGVLKKAKWLKGITFMSWTTPPGKVIQELSGRFPIMPFIGGIDRDFIGPAQEDPVIYLIKECLKSRKPDTKLFIVVTAATELTKRPMNDGSGWLSLNWTEQEKIESMLKEGDYRMQAARAAGTSAKGAGATGANGIENLVIVSFDASKLEERAGDARRWASDSNRQMEVSGAASFEEVGHLLQEDKRNAVVIWLEDFNSADVVGFINEHNKTGLPVKIPIALITSVAPNVHVTRLQPLLETGQLSLLTGINYAKDNLDIYLDKLDKLDEIAAVLAAKAKEVEDYEAYLKNTAIGGPPRELEGHGRTYEAFVEDYFTLTGLLENGFVSFLNRLNNRGLPWCWMDGGGGAGLALLAATKKYDKLVPLLIDALECQENNYDGKAHQRIVESAERLNISLPWTEEAKKRVNFNRNILSPQLKIIVPKEAPLNLTTLFAVLGFIPQPLETFFNLYNQLSPGGVIMANLAIPKIYPEAENLYTFYRNVFEELKEKGVECEIRIRDCSQEGYFRQGIDVSNEYMLGITMVKGSSKPKNVQLLAKSKDPVIVEAVTTRKITYTVVPYVVPDDQICVSVAPAATANGTGDREMTRRTFVSAITQLTTFLAVKANVPVGEVAGKVSPDTLKVLADAAVGLTKTAQVIAGLSSSDIADPAQCARVLDLDGLTSTLAAWHGEASNLQDSTGGPLTAGANEYFHEAEKTYLDAVRVYEKALPFGYSQEQREMLRVLNLAVEPRQYTRYKYVLRISRALNRRFPGIFVDAEQEFQKAAQVNFEDYGTRFAYLRERIGALCSQRVAELADKASRRARLFGAGDIPALNRDSLLEQFVNGVIYNGDCNLSRHVDDVIKPVAWSRFRWLISKTAGSVRRRTGIVIERSGFHNMNDFERYVEHPGHFALHLYPDMLRSHLKRELFKRQVHHAVVEGKGYPDEQILKRINEDIDTLSVPDLEKEATTATEYIERLLTETGYLNEEEDDANVIFSKVKSALVVQDNQKLAGLLAKLYEISPDGFNGLMVPVALDRDGFSQLDGFIHSDEFTTMPAEVQSAVWTIYQADRHYALISKQAFAPGALRNEALRMKIVRSAGEWLMAMCAPLTQRIYMLPSPDEGTPLGLSAKEVDLTCDRIYLIIRDFEEKEGELLIGWKFNYSAGDILAIDDRDIYETCRIDENKEKLQSLSAVCDVTVLEIQKLIDELKPKLAQMNNILQAAQPEEGSKEAKLLAVSNNILESFPAIQDRLNIKSSDAPAWFDAARAEWFVGQLARWHQMPDAERAAFKEAFASYIREQHLAALVVNTDETECDVWEKRLYSWGMEIVFTAKDKKEADEKIELAKRSGFRLALVINNIDSEQIVTDSVNLTFPPIQTSLASSISDQELAELLMSI